MMKVVDLPAEDLATKVLEEVKKQPLPLLPKRVEILEDVDSFGELAWRLRLVLPAPDGPTWDREQVFQARRAAIDVFDSLVAGARTEHPGRTVAFVTTDEAADEDVATEDAPEDGEDSPVADT